MARRTPPEDVQQLLQVLRDHDGPLGLVEIEAALAPAPPRRTLQARLKALVEAGSIIREGAARAAKYRLSDGQAEATGAIPLSAAAAALRAHVQQPLTARRPVGYDATLLETYDPATAPLLTDQDRAKLAEIGTPITAEQPAGTYARNILDRLLIDLSWNSSRLEGNTYSLLDTRRLIAFGEAAEGKDQIEAQMILNHKDAIEFLVDTAGETGFDRMTLLNLHALLANNLLPDPTAAGRLRQIEVAISGSVFQPLALPQMIDTAFDRLCRQANTIDDPFEQALFILLHLPYLQPFDDVNKRVSRLAANIPMIRRNLIPLSFADVPQTLYTQAMLAFYETGNPALMRDVFLWAYQRSADRYRAVQQSLGQPDPFRLRYRDELRTIVAEILRAAVPRHQTPAQILDWAAAHVPVDDRARFRAVVEDELLGLHPGNFARYRVTPSEFNAWQAVWAHPS
ncbi:Fic family protein [uncultured Roseobacter sp.]|uniref:Fic family protein n=1 Tax=uncultured Roseobacter sp. TaxID=114847 RepID=UPI0026210AFC|nr:Fic family protein [uncultured Roseobacter sp.]